MKKFVVFTALLCCALSMGQSFNFACSSGAALPPLLESKLTFEGRGSVEWALERRSGSSLTYTITPTAATGYRYWQYTDTTGERYSLNSFQVTLSSVSSPVVIRFSPVYHDFSQFDNLYAVAEPPLATIHPEAIASIERSLNLLKGHGFDLSDAKVVLTNNSTITGVAFALGIDTVVYPYQDHALALQHYDYITDLDWPAADQTLVHEFFHLIDGRLGASHSTPWRSAYSAANALHTAGRYSIPDTGCYEIRNEWWHYELSSLFEFFAVTMTARVNQCSRTDTSTLYNDNQFTFRTSTVLGNAQQLQALLPEVYALGTALLSN